VTEGAMGWIRISVHVDGESNDLMGLVVSLGK